MSLLMKTLMILLVIECAKLAQSSRILVIFPVPLRDHQVIFQPLIENLIDRGHNLTIVTTDPPQNVDGLKENVEIIDLSFAHRLPVLNTLKNHEHMLSGSDMLRTVFHVMRTVAEAELESPQMQSLLADDACRRFDVVIVDWSGPTLMNAFAAKFEAPLIGITPGGAYVTSHEAIGNPNHPVAFPSILMPFSEDLNLFQRIASTVFAMKYRYLYFYEELPLQDEIVRKFFGHDIPTLSQIESNADLLLVNSYQALGNSRPVGPTTIYLGGIHAGNRLEPLPWQLQRFLDESPKVVYINLGEAITRAFVDSYRMEKLINILEKTSFDVVLNTNGLELIPFNTTVKLYQSAQIPQESLLAHQNVQLFITTGCQRDIEDAILHKVPVMGLTFSSNLDHYLLQIVKSNAGVVFNIDVDLSAEILGKVEGFAITERFQQNMDKLSAVVHDQPMTSVERGTWWIEYVIRNGGTHHLKHSWNQLSWFQYLLVDVFVAITAAIMFVAFVTAAICIKICIKIRRYSKSLPFEKITRRTKAKMT